MAGKQHLVLNSFHNGLNTKINSRDIADDNLAISDNISVDDVGRLTMSGVPVAVSLSSHPTMNAGNFVDGYNLFRFSSDYNTSTTGSVAAGSILADTNYIIIWNDADGKFYWLPGTTTWETITALDLSSNHWGTYAGGQFTYHAIPNYYYVDGALRVCDTVFTNLTNPNYWIGTINRVLFPDATAVTLTGWDKQVQELLKPLVGTISKTTTSSPSTGIHWIVKNLIPEDDLGAFTASADSPGAGTTSGDSNNNLYTHTESLSYSDGNKTGSGMNDEHWQTSSKHLHGYNDEVYHEFGFAMHGEDDDDSNNYIWTGLATTAFNTGGGSKSFSSGQSIYVAVRLPGDENKDFWTGSHVKNFSDEASLSLSISDAYINFKESSGNDFLKFKIDHTKFTDTSTPSGQWHIIEFAYDDAFENSTNGTFNPSLIELEIALGWNRVNTVYSNGTSSGTPNPYTKYRDIPGFTLIQLSDMRLGDSDLVGVTTVGKQKFLMSYTYDETDNESLLHDFGSTDSNELGNIVFENSTSSYQIGIQARISASVVNKRVTGANLYMEDDGIPYRIANLKYMKGLKGAWESEYPTSGRFSDVSSDRLSSTVKTDGLPLLESYEAMNGFSPNVDTITARYKTSTILNRRTYIGNIFQNSKVYSDRMIKSNANSFDVFPSEGKGIDVIKSDGDSIIKLESYADRILQFKKNVMYLINATRDSEFLEDTFYGKGIYHPSSSCVTDVGIAWVNENGCFLYDGEKVNSLTEGKILDTEWQTFITSSSDIAYLPLKKKLIISGGSSAVDSFEYSFYTKSWNKGTSKFIAEKTNFILDIDDDIKYFTKTGTNLYKWDDSSSTSNAVRILTKDFTFGNPASRKKCFKFYVTYKCTGVSNLKIYHGTNGQDLTQSATGEEISTSSKFAGTSVSCYASTGLATTVESGATIWKQAELLPSNTINNVYSVQLHFKASGTVPADFEINDITIVYREKPMK
tara:strand:- start:377 stop:3295 length:2919 start_codon:yes stop_codon:yes gene_type:complete